MLQIRVQKYLSLRFEPSSHRSINTCFIFGILLLMLFIMAILLWILPGIEIVTMVIRFKNRRKPLLGIRAAQARMCQHRKTESIYWSQIEVPVI